MSKESRRRVRALREQTEQVMRAAPGLARKRRRRWLGLGLMFAALLLIAGTVLKSRLMPPSLSPIGATKTADFVQPKTLAELLALPPDQLEKVDLALLNLLCAEGLRGAEDLDVRRVLGVLDAWTAHVASETRRNQHLFDEHPERFKNSLAYFRMAMMATVLVQDLRIRYHPEREQQLENGHTLRTDAAEMAFFAAAKDVFIHGLLSGQHYGTCASLPFLYAAIGRRLGYPVTLASTATHFYVRYDEGGGKHLNVEATEHRAFVTPSDDEYRNPWELRLSEEEVQQMAYLQPMSNREILGWVLLTRSAVLKSMRQFDQQAETWATAAKYLPDTQTWKEIVRDMQLLARNTAEQDRREALWQKVARLYVPHGPGYAYFQDKKVRLHLLINSSPNKAAIGGAIEAFEHELAEHIGPIEPGDRRTPVPFGSTLPPLLLRRVLPSGKEMKISADLLPPFARGIIPAELVRRVDEKKLDDEDAILAEFWAFYDEQAQAAHRTAQARQEAARRRVLENASGGPILIAREQVPPEYWDGIPYRLQVRLTGLHDERQIVEEMWAFRPEEEVRSRQEQERVGAEARNQVLALLRQHDIRLPINFGNPAPLAAPSPPFATTQNPIPEMYRQWITPDIARQLTAADIGRLQQNERNLKQAEKLRQQLLGSGPPMTRIQLVSTATLNGGMPPPAAGNFPLTPPPPSPTKPVLNGNPPP